MDNGDNGGWIKIYRKMLDWSWFKKPDTVQVFLTLLLSANHKDQYWQNIKVKRGQLVTGRHKLHEITGLSERTIRTCINRLKSTNEITVKSTNKYSIITICNYDKYNPKKEKDDQHNDQQSDQQPTSNRPATDQQPTTNKNIRKKRIKEEIPESGVSLPPAKDFIDSIIEEYLKAFPDYELADPGKERKMAGKLLGFFKKKYPDKDSNGMLSLLAAYFKKCKDVPDEWLKANMSLGIIVSKYNAINNILKSGTRGRKRNPYSVLQDDGNDAKYLEKLNK